MTPLLLTLLNEHFGNSCNAVNVACVQGSGKRVSSAVRSGDFRTAHGVVNVLHHPHVALETASLSLFGLTLTDQ